MGRPRKVQPTAAERLEAWVTLLREDLAAAEPLFYTKIHEDDPDRERPPTVWPNGAKCVMGLVSWYGRPASHSYIYRNVDRTLFAMRIDGRKRGVTFDEVIWLVPTD